MVPDGDERSTGVDQCTALSGCAAVAETPVCCALPPSVVQPAAGAVQAAAASAIAPRPRNAAGAPAIAERKIANAQRIIPEPRSVNMLTRRELQPPSRHMGENARAKVLTKHPRSATVAASV